MALGHWLFTTQNSQPHILQGTPFAHCLHRPHHVISEFISLSKALGLKVSALKSKNHMPSLVFATHRESSHESRLILAGTHGDEPAGVLGILAFLRNILLKNELAKYPPFAILPLVSPSAYGLAQRNNAWSENANRGYHTKNTRCAEAVVHPSREGQTLVENISTLLKHSKNGAMSLHEDTDTSQFYLYSYQKSTLPGVTPHAMSELGSQFFGKIADSDNFENSRIRDGIVHNDFGAGALDELLYTEGCPLVLVTETPGKQNLILRTHVNALLSRAFLLDQEFVKPSLS